MIISSEQFFSSLADKTLKLAFIGMSNTGKSFRSCQIESQFGIPSIHVDQHIESNLNLPNMEAMAQWLGYPFEPQYAERSQTYLALEKKYSLPQISKSSGMILDTTGSVIYHDTTVQKFLKENFLVIFFDVPEERIQEMQAMFFSEPKSVYWGNSFQPLPNEDNHEALKRCYPNLIQDRIDLYKQWADISLPAEISKMEGLSVERFIEIISFALPNA